MEFQFWQHRTGGEIYAVRYSTANGTLEIIGVCGPLGLEEIIPAELPNYDYEPVDNFDSEAFRLYEG